MKQTTQRGFARAAAILLLSATLLSTACQQTPPVEIPTDSVTDGIILFSNQNIE